MKFDLSMFPMSVLIGLAVLLVIEFTLAVIALVSLYRRPLSNVTLGNKWIWVAIIVLVSLLGPILYLVLGRKVDVPAEQSAPTRTSGATAESIADSLYGHRDESDRS